MGEPLEQELVPPVTATHARGEINKRTIIRAKAPLRLSFAGGGTDLVQYYQEHGGAVLSTTINRYSYVTLYPRHDQEVRIRSMDVGTIVSYALDKEPVFDGVLDLAKAAIRRMGVEVGFELDVYTEAPRGSGLGGSSAVTSAILGAVREYTGVLLDHYELSELNYNIERVDLGIAGGKQDQYATTFGGFNLIAFSKERVLVTPLRIDRDILNDLECHLMLCYTGHVRPGMGLIETQMRYFNEKRPSTLDAMKRVHDQSYMMMESLLHGRLTRFGELLDEAYRAKREMNPHVSNPGIDAMYDLAKKNGALGGKLCGAGGGGYLLLYVPGAHQHDVRKALEHAGGQIASFAFEERGLQTWRSRCR
jgi:D-glycero-alpha-D-manno-heptose-7-phosphate kinase